MAYLAEGRHREAPALVEENGVASVGVGGALQSYVYFPRVLERRIPYPVYARNGVLVDGTAVLAAYHLVVYVAGVHQIILAQVVGAYDGSPVVGLLVLEYSVRSEAAVLQSQVQGRSDVLGGEYLYVGLLGLRSGQQGAPVGEFGVRVLGIVLEQVLGRVAPAAVRGVEQDVLLLVPLEVIVFLQGGARNAQPARVYVLFQERTVVEAVVISGVEWLELQVVDIAVVGPVDYAPVLQGIRQDIGLQYPRSGGQYAVLAGLYAVLAVEYAVHAGNLGRQRLLVEIFFPFAPAHLGPFLLEEPLCSLG